MSDSSPAVKGKFEIERDGEVSYLVYETHGAGWISLLYTWVSPALLGRGIANELAQLTLEYAKGQALEGRSRWWYSTSSQNPSTSRSLELEVIDDPQP